jgi:TolB-like protein/Tfp pilus assembly protein PilF
MASLIAGYEYDIFISYRQKDNKNDGWITEFVDNLKHELESTFKEDINVYFDINPHDGLLETHDVDATLKEKLKCLVCIPIISHTYCDPKSFAWEHEFKSFIEQASQDQFGLKVKLPSGNVASRILPVKIHDIDDEDRTLLENELGGVLRSIEFIYKSPGVNRPLRANEDHPQDNLNKTYYRDQINKAANSLKEIITALKKQNQHSGEIPKHNSEVKPAYRSILKTKIISGILIVLILLVTGYILVPKLLNSKGRLEKSIAVLPFVNDSPDQENTYFINGIMDEVLTNLQTIKEFRVLSRTSVEKYKGSDKLTIPQIAKELDVNYFVEGSGQKYGDKFVLRVQLVVAANERQLWAKSFNREIKVTDDIISLQSEIARSIAAELEATISPAEKLLIEKNPTANLTAYDFFQRGNDEFNNGDLKKAKLLYQKALEEDPTFAKAYTGLAMVYWDTHFYKEYLTKNFLDSVLILSDKALSFDSQTSEAYVGRGRYYGSKGILNKAIDEFDKALQINPNLSEAYFRKGQYYASDDFVKSIDNFKTAASLNRGSALPGILNYICRGFLYAGFREQFEYYVNQALILNDDSSHFYYYHAMDELYQNNFEKSLELYLKAYKSDTTGFYTLQGVAMNLNLLGRYKEALTYLKLYISKTYAQGNYNLHDMHRIGYTFSKNGYIKEAEYYFDKQIEICNNSNKLGRQYAQELSSYYDLAAVYAFMGNKEKAYQNLRIFNQIKVTSIWLVWYIKNDPLFDSIRNEPEFQQIIRDVETKFQAEHERVRKWLEEQGRT